jgi:hypothetical protein
VLADTVGALGFTDGFARIDIRTALPWTESESESGPGAVHGAHTLRIHPTDVDPYAIERARSEWEAMVLLPAYGVRMAEAGDRSFAGGELAVPGIDDAQWEITPGRPVEEFVSAPWLASAPGCSDPAAVEATLRAELEPFGLQEIDVRVGGALGCVAQVDAIAPDPVATMERIAEGPLPTQAEGIPNREGVFIAIRDRDGADVYADGIAEAYGSGTGRVAAAYDAIWETQDWMQHGGATEPGG